jgi:hypothetical protein
MSPEQAAGLVDRLGPASDIYSLGATLYNILAGKPPVTDKDVRNTLTRVMKGDFPHPRMINNAIPRPLEGIVLKAMALNPEERYPSVKALGQDVENWMAGEPVSAYRDPWPSRLARWARRHRTTVAAAAALVLTAVVGLTAGSILLERERTRTERERLLAVKNYGFAYEAAETMLSRVGDVDLADIPQMEPVRLELLKTARVQFENLLKQESQDEQVLLLEARTRARLGDVLEMMGLNTEAEQNYRDAIASSRALQSRPRDDDRPARVQARAYHGLGVLLRKLNRFREAESWLREAVRLREQLAAGAPADPERLQELSESRYYLGALLARLVRPDAVDRQLYDQAIQDQHALIDNGDPKNRLKLARYRNNLAILEARRDKAKADRDFHEVLEILAEPETASTLPAARWQRARASNNLAILLLASQQDADAETLWSQARDELAPLSAQFPRINQYRRELASVLNNLGNLARNRDQHDLATDSFRQVTQLLEELARTDPDVPDYQQNLEIARFELELLRLEAGQAADTVGLDRILATQESLIAEHPEVPDYRNALGRNLLEYGTTLFERVKGGGAQPLVDRASGRFQEALEADPGNQTYVQNLADALILQMLIALEARDLETVSTVADRLVDLRGDDLKAYLTASMGLAHCVELTAQDQALAPEIREQRVERFGQRAVEILQKALTRELLQSAELLNDKKFLPLFTRPDFIDLVKELMERKTPVIG